MHASPAGPASQIAAVPSRAVLYRAVHQHARYIAYCIQYRTVLHCTAVRQIAQPSRMLVGFEAWGAYRLAMTDARVEGSYQPIIDQDELSFLADGAALVRYLHRPLYRSR